MGWPINQEMIVAIPMTFIPKKLRVLILAVCLVSSVSGQSGSPGGEPPQKALDDVGTIGVRAVNQGDLDLFSEPDALRMGSDFYVRLRGASAHPRLDAPKVRQYLKGLLARIVAASDEPTLRFRVYLVDRSVAHAFALQGGILIVYRGLIEATRTEAELAAVLAHQIAHVTARHGTESVTAAIGQMARGTAVDKVLETPSREGFVTDLARSVILADTRYWLIGGDRHREFEADLLGAQYAWRAGYDPTGLRSFLQHAGRTSLRIGFTNQASAEERIAALNALYRRLPYKRNLIVSSPRFAAVKTHLDALTIGANNDTTADDVFQDLKEINEAILTNEIKTWYGQ